MTSGPVDFVIPEDAFVLTLLVRLPWSNISLSRATRPSPSITGAKGLKSESLAVNLLMLTTSLTNKPDVTLSSPMSRDFLKMLL